MWTHVLSYFFRQMSRVRGTVKKDGGEREGNCRHAGAVYGPSPHENWALQDVVGKLSPQQLTVVVVIELRPRVVEPAAGEPARAERQVQRQAVPVAPPPLPVQQPLLRAGLEGHRQALLQLASEVALAGEP